MMNQEIKKQWCEALKIMSAPNQKQYIASLRSGGFFAFDGVLTDIYLKAHGLDWEIIESKYCALGRSCALPDAVAIWAGLTEKSIKIKKAVYDDDGNLISKEEKYSVDVCTYDPLLPSYNLLPEGKRMDNPRASKIVGEGLDFITLAELIEKDL